MPEWAVSEQGYGGRVSSEEDALVAIGSPDTSQTEEPIDVLLREAHLVGPHQVAGLLRRHAAALGLTDTVVYLSDLQQLVLIPLVEPAGPGLDRQLGALGVDSTVAGRCYQNVEMVVQQPTMEGVRVWMPLLDGAERLGVLGVTTTAVAAEVILSRTLYGDTLVRLRRRREHRLAAELQWGLLPPLTFACPEVTVAGALEPAYEVAGDSLDYAVDAGSARFAVFDGMGHGLHSAQLTALTVAAYRNARRSDMSLTDTIEAIDVAVSSAHPGSFVTAVIAELDTDTGLLSWVNVGHPEPMLLRGRRAVKSLHNMPTLPFGISRALGREVAVYVRTEQLEPGDRLLLYTDGVTDIRSPNGEFFDVHRLLDLLAANLAARLPIPETMRRLVRSLLDHQQGPLSDDATMLLVEWRSGNERTLLPS
jgi:serine phosphatase RsbU (regulator of sigma subunit)